jgi:hypothetical protein
MKIVNIRHSHENNLLSCIIEYRDRLFRITNCSIPDLYIWSEFSGWLFIEHGRSKDSVGETIDQFSPLIRTYSYEKENQKTN